MEVYTGKKFTSNHTVLTMCAESSIIFTAYFSSNISHIFDIMWIYFATLNIHFNFLFSEKTM